MNTYTEYEAIQRWCPHAMLPYVHRDAHGTAAASANRHPEKDAAGAPCCIGSRCMGWLWSAPAVLEHHAVLLPSRKHANHFKEAPQLTCDLDNPPLPQDFDQPKGEGWRPEPGSITPGDETEDRWFMKFVRNGDPERRGYCGKNVSR